MDVEDGIVVPTMPDCDCRFGILDDDDEDKAAPRPPPPLLLVLLGLRLVSII